MLYLVFADQYWPSLIGTVCSFRSFDDFNEIRPTSPNNTRPPTYSRIQFDHCISSSIHLSLSPESRSRRLFCLVSSNPITNCLQSPLAYSPKGQPSLEWMYVHTTFRILQHEFLLIIKPDAGHQHLSKPFYPLETNPPSSEPYTRGSS